MSKPRRVAFYARVSTKDQTVENQLKELREVAERAGWEVVQVFSDEGISGAKSRAKRPGLDAMLKGLTRREFNTVAAWSVDRLGRSTKDLIDTLGAIQGVGAELYLHKQAIDTSTPGGKALFHMLGVFAEFERSIIQERVRAGMERARASGKRIGRAPASEETIARIKALRAEGMGIRKVAATLGCGVSLVQRVEAEA